MGQRHYPFLRPQDLRAFNREASHAAAYLTSEEWRPRVDVEKSIANVPNKKLQSAIDAARLEELDQLVQMGDFLEEEARMVVAAPWVRHMALHCGLHFWPDANHRTAVFGFNLALERHVGLHVKMDAETGGVMLRESKAIRPTLQEQGRLTLSLLVEPDHPYQQLFRRYCPHLRITDEVDERDRLYPPALA